jgi:hypothetical protein
MDIIVVKFNAKHSHPKRLGRFYILMNLFKIE